MAIFNKQDSELRDILLKGSYITKEDAAAAEKALKADGGGLFEYLISEELLTSDLIGQAVAEHYKLPYLDLNSNPPSSENVLKLEEEVAKSLRVVLYKEDDKSVTVATDSPANPELKTTLATLFPKKKLNIGYSLSQDIDDIFTNYRKPLETRFSQIIEKKGRIAPEIIDEIFLDAHTFKASDIHFEPQREVVIVRFRVDGVLQEAGRIEKRYYENIINRVKVEGHMRIDQHLEAQDGSMHYEKDDVSFDVRVSIVPTVEGEKIVLRILSSYVKGFSLEDLGLSPDNQSLLKNAGHKPFGMVLVVGPTGSGKTTTLYSLIRLIKNPGINITTIEDPVEYKMDGVNQIQTNSETNLTFAKGLRSVVRQDPDVILVGEIRDEETAEIAVNAALTGHLLLSTFHANDAATAVPRLLDMNIEPFLLASTLEVVVAQRLVRRTCEHCKRSVVHKASEMQKKFSTAKKYFKGKNITLYEGKGCNVCGNTGYHGRTAIFEIIKVTREMQELIMKSPSALDVWNLAEEQGAKHFFEDGIDKVKAGVTTLDELLRVAPPS